jgi:serine/threonine protein kinase
MYSPASSIFGKTYRIILNENQSNILSEQEVFFVLQQVLFQLAQSHSQGYGHGNISLDTLIKQSSDGQAILVHNAEITNAIFAAPEQLQTGEVTTAADIYSLGATLITLLTNGNPEALRSRTWNWQDDCVISDQLAALLEKAIAPNPQHRFANAMQMLQQINAPATATPQPVTSQSTDLSNSQPIASWKWAFMGIGGTLLLGLAGFGGVKLLQAKTASTPVTFTSTAPTSTPSQITSASVLQAPETATPTPQPIEETEDLSSEAGVNYSRLLNLLKTQQLKEADLETTRLLLSITRREKENSLDAASLSRLPCGDLATIDRLWRKNSDDRFGFSIQNEIWQQSGRDATRFADRVGWLGQTNLKDYQDLNFSPSAQIGHLPIGDYGPLYLSGIRKFNPALEARLSYCLSETSR